MPSRWMGIADRDFKFFLDFVLYEFRYGPVGLAPHVSPEDAHVTRYIAEAGELLGIELLDHLVIGDQRWVSLKEHGLGFSL